MNMANYVDFQGKSTNKKVQQAPGGSSSLSLAWGNQKTDYGPPRNSKTNQQRPPNYPPLPQKKQQQSRQYQQDYSPYNNYNDPYKNPNNYQQNQNQYNKLVENNNIFGNYDSSSNYKDYHQPVNQNNYKNQQSSYQGNNYGNSYGNNQYNGQYKRGQQALDRALYQHQVKKPTSQSKNDGRSCIKINGPPKQQFSIGDNSYNYWKDKSNNTPEKRNSNQRVSSLKKIDNQRSFERPPSYQNLQKPSIRVNNPPGGKSNIQFG